jgi:DNA-directed RNA polymerase specialized sigma24 family protein
VLAVVRKVEQFRGDSRFTTWAYAFVVLEVAGKVGRHFWTRRTTPYDAEDWDRLPDRFGVGPVAAAEHAALLAAVRRAVDEVLTPHQRTVFVAVVVNAVPLDALVVELGTNRNAIYKTMFDARRKLRAALVADGYLDVDEVTRR